MANKKMKEEGRGRSYKQQVWETVWCTAAVLGMIWVAHLMGWI